MSYQLVVSMSSAMPTEKPVPGAGRGAAAEIDEAPLELVSPRAGVVQDLTGLDRGDVVGTADVPSDRAAHNDLATPRRL